MERVNRRRRHFRIEVLLAASPAALACVSAGAMGTDTLIVNDTSLMVTDDRTSRGNLPGFLVQGTGALTVGKGGVVGNPGSYSEVIGAEATLDVQGEGTVVGNSLVIRDGKRFSAGMNGEGTAQIKVETLEVLGNSVVTLDQAHVGLGVDQNLTIKLDENSTLIGSARTYIDGGIGVVDHARMALHGSTVDAWTVPAIDVRDAGADGVRIDEGAIVRGGVQAIRVFRGQVRIENSEILAGHLGPIGTRQTRPAGLAMVGTSLDSHVVVDKETLIQGIGDDAVGVHIENDGSGTQLLEVRGNSVVHGQLHGVYAEPRIVVNGTESSRIQVVDALLEGRTGDAVHVNDTSVNLELADGARLIALQGKLVRTEGKGVIDMTVRNTRLDGDISNGPRGTMSVTLGPAGVLQGAALNVSHMRVDTGGAFFMERDSDIARLEMGGGAVRLSSAPGTPHILRVGELTGQGTFVMHEDFQRNTGDLLHVTGRAEGNHVLSVPATGNEPSGTGFTVVKTGSGGAQFALAGDGTVDVGTYRYGIARQGNDWVLAPVPDPVDPGEDPGDDPGDDPDGDSGNPDKPGNPDNPANPDNPDKPDNPGAPAKPDKPDTPGDAAQPDDSNDKPDTPSETPGDRPAATPDRGAAEPDPGANPVAAPRPRLSNSANMVLGLASAARVVGRAQGAMVGSRLDQLRGDPGHGSSMWAKPYTRRYAVTPVQGARYTLRQDGMMIGADTQVGKRYGDTYAGAAIGTGTSKLNFGHGNGAKAQFDELSAVLYGTWYAESGWYADAAAGLHRFSVATHTPMSDGRQTRGRYRQLAVSTNLEAGKTLPLWGDAFAEPYGRAELFNGQRVKYTLDNGMAVRQAPQITAQEEIGVRVGTTLTLRQLGDTKVRPYVKLAGFNVHGYGGRTRINGRNFDTGLRNGTGAIVGLGVATRAADRLYLVAEAQRASGPGLRQQLGIDLGVRYVW